MSAPFAQLCAQRSRQYTDAELSEKAFGCFNRWALQSSGKLVSLDDVAWIGAMMLRALKDANIEVFKRETVNENGARVVGIVASDGVKVADGAA